jgi:hypothetical protein
MSIKQATITMITIVNGFNWTGGCGAATDLTGASAVEAALVVRLVTETFITICRKTLVNNNNYT